MSFDFPEINGSFRFECTLCGDCCTGDQEVLLNPFDLYRMARFLRYPSTRQLFAQQWVELVPDPEHNVWRPRIKFKTRPFKFCPFLINEMDDLGQLKGLCRLHPEFKPLVCFLAPVGCRYDAEQRKTQFLLVPPTQDCPGMKADKENDLQEYLAEFEEALHFQEMFFEILEEVKNLHLPPERFLKELYDLPTDAPFPDVFSRVLTALRARLHA